MTSDYNLTVHDDVVVVGAGGAGLELFCLAAEGLPCVQPKYFQIRSRYRCSSVECASETWDKTIGAGTYDTIKGSDWLETDVEYMYKHSP